MSSFVANGRKIIAIGRNYALHAKELGNKVPTEPFFFLKPTSSYLATGGTIELPRGENVQQFSIFHKQRKLRRTVELGVVIGKKGRDIPEGEAMNYSSSGRSARNAQDRAKAKGLPWSAAKGFDTFSPVSHFLPASAIKDPHNLELYLNINGNEKQRGNTRDMIFRIPHLISFCSSIMTIEENDLIMTGTPAGVGPILSGDKLIAGLIDPETKQELLRWDGDAKDREAGYAFSK